MIGDWVKCGWYHQLITSYWLYHDQHHEYSCVWFSCMALGHWQIHGWQGVSRRVGFSWRSGVCSEAWRHTAWGHAFPWQSAGHEALGSGWMMGSQFREVYRLGWTCKWGTCAGVCASTCVTCLFLPTWESQVPSEQNRPVWGVKPWMWHLWCLALEILVFAKNGYNLLTLILFQTRMLLFWPWNAKGEESSCRSFHSYNPE